MKEAVGSCGNIKFLPYQEREALSQSLAAGDVHLTSLDPRVDGLLLPSKLFGIMAASRPVLHVGSDQSDVSELLNDSGCGLVSPVGDVEGLVSKILNFRDQPGLASTMGLAGRKSMEEMYDKKLLISRFIKLVESTKECSEGAPSPVKIP